MTRASFLLTLVLASACGDARPRCSACGMYADAAPRWAAGAENTQGEVVRFDAPRCLFQQKARGGLREAWVTEYYSQARRDAANVTYVVGSDLIGPMGKDFVPVDAANVDRFVREHGGRRIAYASIDAAAVERLDR